MGYLERVAQIGAELRQKYGPGVAWEITVKHNDECPMLQGKACCTCGEEVDIIVNREREAPKA